MKRIFLAGLAALTVLAAGCSKDDSNGNENSKETASLSVRIKAENSNTRATGAPTTVQENSVKSFTVYVFNNASGAFEASGTFTNATEGTVSGLSVASSKKVVVLVNKPTDFPAISNYSDFALAVNYLNLDTQEITDFDTQGLFMSGETTTPVILNTTGTNEVTIPVSRIVAKVRLGNLTVTPESGLDLADFELLGVSIQRTRDMSPVLGGLATSGFNYASGIVLSGQTETQKPYLLTNYSLPGGYTSGTAIQPNIYFYVFPNDNTNNSPTLMSLHGTYQGTDMYYSFIINNKNEGAGENDPDGTWIKRNMVYTLNVGLKKLNQGGDNPNVPNEQVSLDVTITVTPWEGELIQDVEW